MSVKVDPPTPRARRQISSQRAIILEHTSRLSVAELPRSAIWSGDVESFLDRLPQQALFDLIITSPPYNLGKSYENRQALVDYVAWQERIIEKCVSRLRATGSICWQVGNHVVEGRGGRTTSVLPLDFVFHEIFDHLGLRLRNRIIWRFGHGLHCKHRFSGRYEVVLWYTRSDDYVFNLDSVRIPSKYPSKKHYKGPRVGQYSGNPLGKNPEDVWDIPNVKSNHVEKTDHPCQFPVALVERLILALSDSDALVFDPFAGVMSTGVAAAITGRRFLGCELEPRYVEQGTRRVDAALRGAAKYRPGDRPIYDHTKSKLSLPPQE